MSARPKLLDRLISAPAATDTTKRVTSETIALAAAPANGKPIEPAKYGCKTLPTKPITMKLNAEIPSGVVLGGMRSMMTPAKKPSRAAFNGERLCEYANTATNVSGGIAPGKPTMLNHVLSITAHSKMMSAVPRLRQILI